MVLRQRKVLQLKRKYALILLQNAHITESEILFMKFELGFMEVPIKNNIWLFLLIFY